MLGQLPRILIYLRIILLRMAINCSEYRRLACSDVLGSEALDIRECYFVRQNRRGRGGGVGLYIKDKIPIKYR